MKDPVIVIGMARSGTTLVSEMLHQGGTSMFAEGMDPAYDGGNKYERVLCQDINLEILGVKSVPAISSWKRPLNDISENSLQRLREEVGEKPWGFKDPRTTITYFVWRKVLPHGPTIYTYRSHEEVLRHYFHTSDAGFGAVKRTRRALKAWINYNEQLLKNLRADREINRPAALVRYEELMEDNDLIAQLQSATGVVLRDSRQPNLRRNKESSPRGRFESLAYFVARLGYQSRLKAVYAALAAQRLIPRTQKSCAADS